jgi:plastocyanin
MEQAPKPTEPAKPKSKRTMYAVVGVVIIIVVAVLGLYLTGFFGSNSPTAQISIVDDGTCASQSAACKFTPTTYQAHVGDTVTWKNNGAIPHTVTFTGTNPPSPSDTTLGSGKTVSVTFPTAGTYQYKCTIHLWMTANVTVT